MNKKTLNITNGDYFNNYLIREIGEDSVAFREVMMDGAGVSDIFSEEFIQLRAAELGVDLERYRENMTILDALNKDAYSELILWFGKDTFCQTNLLTLLAYLEQISYSGKVILNYIDDESFVTIEKDIDVELGLYHGLYEEIFVLKRMPQEFGVLYPHAFKLYFDYCLAYGTLADTVRKNADKTDADIVRILLENSKEYGLSDIQAEKLIKKYKN